MGGRGSSTGKSNNGKDYGTEYKSLLTSGNFEVNENSDELFFVSTFKINEEEGVKAPKKKKCCDWVMLLLIIINQL